MKTFQKVPMAALLLLGLMPRAHAAEIFKNDDLDLSFGGRLQVVGDMDLITADPVRDHFRVFLWDEEDRLFTSGDYQGYKWNFEVAFGGEAINSSNNQLNLLDASADIPLIPDMVTAKVGQFKVPGNLESADYEGNLLFAEKSPIFNLFFNQGYDTGLSLYGHIGNLDGQAGLVQGGPDVIQRYLPEVLNFPTPMFLRVGYDDIHDDPFHPKQTGFDKPTGSQFAIHATGYWAADSNAGHSEDLGLGGGYLVHLQRQQPIRQRADFLGVQPLPYLGRGFPRECQLLAGRFGFPVPHALGRHDLHPAGTSHGRAIFHEPPLAQRQ